MNYMRLSAMFRIITIFCFLNLSDTVSTRSHLRVFHGRDAVEGEYPFVVLLVTKKKKGDGLHRFCTASAISQKWVLSAGHCVEHKEANKTFVWHTNFTIPPENTKLLTKVLKLITHPGYVHNPETRLNLYNDVSLLHTEELTVARYGRLLAVDHLTMIGLPVQYVGGGQTLDPKQDTYRPLQVGQAAITACETRRKLFQIHMICVSAKCSNKKQKAFRGDSGGPLMHEDNIIGVCSYGRKSRKKPISVFAPVSPYIDWIYTVMHNHG